MLPPTVGRIYLSTWTIYVLTGPLVSDNINGPGEPFYVPYNWFSRTTYMYPDQIFCGTTNNRDVYQLANILLHVYLST